MPNSAPCIRDLVASDIAACARLVSATPLWRRYGYTAARCTADLRAALKRADRIKIAEVGPRVVGLAWVMPKGAFGRAPYLKLLAVDSLSRGGGIGVALLRAGEAGGALCLLVSDFNVAARRFYRREGYRQVGALPAFVLPGVTEILMYRVPAVAAVSCRGPSRRAAKSPTR